MTKWRWMVQPKVNLNLTFNRKNGTFRFTVHREAIFKLQRPMQRQFLSAIESVKTNSLMPCIHQPLPRQIEALRNRQKSGTDPNTFSTIDTHPATTVLSTQLLFNKYRAKETSPFSRSLRFLHFHPHQPIKTATVRRQLQSPLGELFLELSYLLMLLLENHHRQHPSSQSNSWPCSSSIWIRSSSCTLGYSSKVSAMAFDSSMKRANTFYASLPEVPIEVSWNNREASGFLSSLWSEPIGTNMRLFTFQILQKLFLSRLVDLSIDVSLIMISLICQPVHRSVNESVDRLLLMSTWADWLIP